MESEAESHADSDVGLNGRRFRSPQRVLARSIRMGRDNWKKKHQSVQETPEQERQLSADRGRSREQWKQKCETATSRAEQAEMLAQQRLEELDQARAEFANLMSKKKRSATCCDTGRWFYARHCHRQSPSPGDHGWFITAIVDSHLRNLPERSGSGRSSSVRQRSALVAAADGAVCIARTA